MNILSSAAPSEHLRWFLHVSALQETKADHFQGYTTCKWVNLGYILRFFAMHAFFILSHSHGRFLDRFICGEGGLLY